MIKLKLNDLGFTVFEIILSLVVIALIVGAAFFIYHKEHKSMEFGQWSTTSQFNTDVFPDSGGSSTVKPSPTPTKIPNGYGACANYSSYTNSQVASFVNAYKDGEHSSLNVLMVCDASQPGAPYINFLLITANKKIKADAVFGASASPTQYAIYKCSLNVISNKSAIVSCDSDSFNLY